jgi:hypothetical protein
MSFSRIPLLVGGTLLVSSFTWAAPDPPGSEEVAAFVVDTGDSERWNTPVSASLQGIAVDPARPRLELYERAGERRVPVASQVDAELVPRLWWILEGVTPPGAERVFELVRAPPADEETSVPPVAVEDDGNALTVTLRGQPVLSYRYSPVPPPAGTSPLYARGGFIHPLWSPDGEVLTRIQPPDHYHHVGIWNPWTHTEFEGREIDFWNLDKGQGTVRFAGLLSTTANAVFGGFRARHEHVDLNAPDPSGAKVALNEEWEVRVWNTDPDGHVWLVDFLSRQSCATDSPLTVKAYRYQGFGFRATATWDDQTATIRTSEGKDKSTGNATRARWCDVRGVSARGTAGIVFMSHPLNFNHPEPLRIWPTGANGGKENVFVNFNPAQDRDWVLEPGRTYTLRYRLLVYDGVVDPATAERCWNDFAHPPTVTRE